MNWNDKPEVQKGSAGERLVLDWLNSRGVIVYLPVSDAAHPFDKLCATPDKKTIFVAEVKTKPCRVHYPDTGVNISNYNDYMHIRNKYTIGVYLFFVDEYLAKIYGNWISELESPCEIEHKGKIYQYPLRQKGIIYFPLARMKDVCVLSHDVVSTLSAIHNGKYTYQTRLE
jgi:hypothetical protein